MLSFVKWLAVMAIVTFFILLIRAMLRKPAGTNQKRWVALPTPELLDRAFKTEQMYEIAERTAKRHMATYGMGQLLELYSEIFKEFDGVPTTDNYQLKGSMVDLGDKVFISIVLKRNEEEITKEYEVSYLHLFRVTDVLSPALLSRLNWHAKSRNSEG